VFAIASPLRTRLQRPLALTWLVIGRVAVEERALEWRFGDAYRSYRSHSPRWLGMPAR
jgi:protein-S-isoprenylcysteine O-methyltransferase Ste14